MDERHKHEFWKYLQWMEDWGNKEGKKYILLDFQRPQSIWQELEKWHVTSGILCRDGVEHQGQFKTWGVISPFMLHGDKGILLSTCWLQCWKSFLKKFESLTLSRLNFEGSGPALVLDSLFSEYIFQGFWTHIFLLGNWVASNHQKQLKNWSRCSKL